MIAAQVIYGVLGGVGLAVFLGAVAALVRDRLAGPDPLRPGGMPASPRPLPEAPAADDVSGSSAGAPSRAFFTEENLRFVRAMRSQIRGRLKAQAPRTKPAFKEEA